MKTYANLSGASNVEFYSSYERSIVVRFRDKWVYAYSAVMLGQQAVDHMNALAKSGRGLNSFLSSTKPAYAQKFFNVFIG